MTGEKRCETMHRLGAGLLLAVMAMLVPEFGLQLGSAFPARLEMQASSEAGEEGNAAENEGSNRTIARIALGAQTTTVGINVVVPLYYTPAQGVELRSLSVEVEWVSQHLRFVKYQRGIAAETIGADVDATLTGTRTDANSIERSTLRIDASVVEEDPKRGLPEGLLAYLTFRVSPDAQAFAIELRPVLVSALDISNPAKKIAQAEMINGKVSIELPGLPPYVTCFFFTH